jgi:alpha-tubulin suppressor-like RCC1 family protein
LIKARGTVFTCGKNDKYQLMRVTNNPDELGVIEGVPEPKGMVTRKVGLTDYGIFVFDIAPKSKELTQKKLWTLQQAKKLCDLYFL